MTTERRERGLKKMSEVYGFDLPDLEGDPFYEVTVDHLFADIWNRPGLSMRDRRLLLLGAITALGHSEIAEIQVGAALRNGELDADQLREIAVFLAHYVGWPSATKLDGAIRKTLAKDKKK
ncbi:carboxymuconolactone decarboxylase family protein [Nocardia seriolae]|uniref:Carboxymuconolactone decarboxylase n=1 Tax=Nocardia seriolae TaxID=37332 RepID=A0A0B8NME0_9NOCA|nr:carboxymuconolactone decarboxylase family protein [Nocardia seriolae]APA94507.1 4-carboxymuconolactone decarboxylase [Nocardia seriolae]MTJ60342.1 carboxymuconolactone decarboxylase family protein [Nocardia seriolae]MTJ74468.1 carboxymuconolactone decarboxylase family protein [Nocardia seriolae]MTJ84820.1 carboxymuconolactone decarboxylase family protein [Nocardia seriolae]MTK28809.1 carboxymuconolactone decarboxylase family protein [Nocardia seriolae]